MLCKRLEPTTTEMAQRLFKQVCYNLEATRDMQGNMMLILNINSDPGATSKQKSFANDIMRNEFCPGVTDRGESSRTQRKFQLYEEQRLKATLGASAKAQANRHLAAGQCNTSGAGAISAGSSRKAADRKPSKTGLGSKGPGLQKTSLKPQGALFKGKGKEGAPRAEKQTHVEAGIGSESD